jgi:hypothetical protein
VTDCWIWDFRFTVAAWNSRAFVVGHVSPRMMMELKPQLNVKLVGDKVLLDQVLRELENNFVVIRTSGIRANDGDQGVHTYVTILEGR